MTGNINDGLNSASEDIHHVANHHALIPASGLWASHLAEVKYTAHL